MKTRSYLLAITVVVLLPVLALSAWGLNLLLEREKESRLTAVEEKTRSFALAIDQEIAVAEGALRVLANTERLSKEDFTGLYKLMQRTVTTSDSWIVLYDASGQALLNTYIEYGTPIQSRYEWVPGAIALKKPSVSNLREGSATQAKVVSVNFPVTTASGKTYLLVYVFRADHFTKLLHSKNFPQTWVVGLFGSDGITIARNLREKEFVGTRVKEQLYSASQRGFSGRIDNFTRDGFWAYNTFTHTERTSWTVAIAAPANEVDGPARSAALYAALALLLALAPASIVIMMFARRLTTSFNLAVGAAKSLELGKIPEPKKTGVTEADLLQRVLHDAGAKLADEDQSRKLLEMERERLFQSEQEARRQAENQNNAKDEFLAMLAHELRNPLAPISAAAEILKISARNEATVLRSGDIIVRQVNHLTTLIDDLLDVSRITRGLVSFRKQEVDIKSVLTSAVEQARPLMESRDHDLHIHMRSTHAAVLGDKTRLIQVVSNLLNNAAKYTPPGGKIALTVEVLDTRVRITVQDNGIGIEPALLPHVFELFRQAKRTPDRSQGGLGLGLTLVRSIVSLHDGHIEAFSDGPGTGSSFVLCLPLIASADADGAALEDAAAVPAGPVRLMVVDDNLDAARSLARLLQAKGHQAIVRDNPLAALDYSRVDPLPLYILDIGLPHMDGYTLARHLRGMPGTANAVLIALTGYGQAHDREAAKTAGFDYHFVKPIDMERLDPVLAAVAHPAFPHDAMDQPT